MTPEETAFDARLAAMDRRLREIQAELVPDREPAFDPPPPPPLPAPPPRPSEPVELLGGLYGRLISSTRELLDGYETALTHLTRVPVAPAGAATVVAGPFASTGELREFEQALAALPGVRQVAIRGYESGDRAVVEVQLDRRNP